MIKGLLPKGIEVSINGQQVLLDENVRFTVLGTNNEQAALELFEIAGLHSVELSSVKPVKAKEPVVEVAEPVDESVVEVVEEVVVDQPTDKSAVEETVAEIVETPAPKKTKKKK